MNDILSITVYSILDHGTHAKHCATTWTKICMNKQNLGVHLIKGCGGNFETLRKNARGMKI